MITAGSAPSDLPRRSRTPRESPVCLLCFPRLTLTGAAASAQSQTAQSGSPRSCPSRRPSSSRPDAPPSASSPRAEPSPPSLSSFHWSELRPGCCCPRRCPRAHAQRPACARMREAGVDALSPHPPSPPACRRPCSSLSAQSTLTATVPCAARVVWLEL